MKNEKVYIHNRRIFYHLTALLLLFVSHLACAGIIESNLTFSTQDQSMWESGEASQLDSQQFYGTTWNETTSVGGFIGGDYSIYNPAWLAWEICPFWCGGEPTKYFNINTETGLEVSATTQGKIGFDIGVKIDSGSVDTLINYDTSIYVPEASNLVAGEFINLNPTSSLTDGEMTSQFPTMSATLDVVMEVSAQFAATGCLTGRCKTASYSTGTIGGSQELIAFNQDGEGGIEYFGGSGLLSDSLDIAVDTGAVTLPTGFPAELEIPVPAGLGNLGTITAHLPEPNTLGGLDDAGTTISSQGQDDFLDISLDVDNMLSVATTGVGGLFGGNLEIGGGFELSYDLINVELGPEIDLVQSFEFTPTLMVDFEFSSPVNVDGYGTVSSISGLKWDELPDMAFIGAITDVFPTFYLGTTIDGLFHQDSVELLSNLFLDIDGNIKVDLLTATFSSIFGDIDIGFGNIINESFDLFSTPALYSSSFSMGGFAPVIGESFSVTIPEPNMIFLFATGVIGFSIKRYNFTSK